MVSSLNAINLNSLETHYTSTTEIVDYQPVTICPMCHRGIVPHILGAITVCPRRDNNLHVWQYCPACHETFISYHYQRPNDLGFIFETAIPSRREPLHVKPEIQAISPNFVQIYTESMFAYHEDCMQIAGMGLRKAIEFLVKDFLISRHPEETEKIKRCATIDAIRKISNEEIKTLAERIEWLANDETHYVRLHPEFDTEGLFRLVEALMYFIVSDIRVQEAKQIEHKKHPKIKPSNSQ